MVSLGLGEVTDLNLATNGTNVTCSLICISISDPLVDDIAVGEHSGREFKSNVPEPSIISAIFSVELVAANNSLPSPDLGSGPSGVQLSQVELVLLFEVFSDVEFIFCNGGLLKLCGEITLRRTEGDLVRVSTSGDGVNIGVVSVNSGSNSEVLDAEDCVGGVKLAVELELSEAGHNTLGSNIVLAIVGRFLDEGERSLLLGLFTCVLVIPSNVLDNVGIVCEGRVTLESVNLGHEWLANLGGASNGNRLGSEVISSLEGSVLVNNSTIRHVGRGSLKLELEVQKITGGVIIWVGLESRGESLFDLATVSAVEIHDKFLRVNSLNSLDNVVEFLEGEVGFGDEVGESDFRKSHERSRVKGVVKTAAHDNSVVFVEEELSLFGIDLNFDCAALLHLRVNRGNKIIVDHIPVSPEVLFILLGCTVGFSEHQVLIGSRVKGGVMLIDVNFIGVTNLDRADNGGLRKNLVIVLESSIVDQVVRVIEVLLGHFKTELELPKSSLEVRDGLEATLELLESNTFRGRNVVAHLEIVVSVEDFLEVGALIEFESITELVARLAQLEFEAVILNGIGFIVRGDDHDTSLDSIVTPD